jgi:predicted RNA methylase
LRPHHLAVTNDNVMTPFPLARALAAAIRPHGVILDPCAGTGHFVRALRLYGRVVSCEIARGRSFFDWTTHVDWIVTNPPWSQFRAFLAHALTVADHVALMASVNHFWTKSRRALVRDAGFGLARIIEFETPKAFPATGFQMGMVVLVRGYAGPCQLETLQTAARTTPSPR